MENAKVYNRIKLIVSLIEMGLTLTILLVLIFSPLGRSIQEYAFIITSNLYLSFLIFLAITGIGSGIILFPLDFYSGFYIEHKFNLSNQSFLQWIWEDIKGLLISLVLGVPLLLIFYFLLLNYEQTWWFILATILFLFSVVLARLAPTLIFPLFYKFTPLQDEELKSKIENLYKKVNLKFSGIFEFNLSKNTKKANAGFTGIRKSKRIILSDTLLSGFDHDEIESVFAHELGHYKKKHIIKHIMIGLISNYLGLFIAAKLYESMVSSLGYSSISDLAALPLLSLVLMLFGIFTMPFGNMLSRKFEFEADEFAIQMTQNRDSFISTMEKLAKMNLADKKPHPIVEFLFYSHPSIEKRISAVKNLSNKNTGDYAAQSV